MVATTTTTATTAWVVATQVSGGQSRRRVYLTSQGAQTAAERDHAAGRAATVTRAKLVAAAPATADGAGDD